MFNTVSNIYSISIHIVEVIYVDIGVTLAVNNCIFIYLYFLPAVLLDLFSTKWLKSEVVLCLYVILCVPKKANLMIIIHFIIFLSQLK